MSGPPLEIDTFATRARPDEKPAETREEPGLWDQFTASVRVMTDTVDDVQMLNRLQAYKPLEQALRERGYKLENQMERMDLFGVDLGAGAPTPVYFKRIFELARKEGIEGLPKTWEEFEQNALRRNGGRDSDQELLSRGQGVGSTLTQFAGSALGSMRDPANAYSTLIPIGASNSIARAALQGGAVNLAVESVQVAGRADNFAALGEEYGFDEAFADLAGAAVGGAVLSGLGKGVEIYAPKVADAAIRKIDPNLDDRQYARAFRQQVPEHMRSPEQEAALFLIERDLAIDDASPYVRTLEGDQSNLAKLQAAIAEVEAGRVPTQTVIDNVGGDGVPPIVPRGEAEIDPANIGGGTTDNAEIKRIIAGVESGGKMIPNSFTGDVFGPYQFYKPTFVSLYQQAYGVSKAQAEKAWFGAQKTDRQVHERLMDEALNYYRRTFEKADVPYNAQTVYLAHFAGAEKAVRMLQVPRETPIEQFFKGKQFEWNPTFVRRGGTVGETIEKVFAKAGGNERATRAGTGQTGAAAPVKREIVLPGSRRTSGYGMRTHPTQGGRKMHQGIDYAAPLGTPIKPAEAGTVTRNFWSDVSGWVISVRHADGSESSYSHMREKSPLAVNASVDQTTVIGAVGTTGRSTGPHLHFSVKDKPGGKFLNPDNWLEQEGRGGQVSDAVPNAMFDEGPPLRPAALDAEQPTVMLNGRQVATQSYRASEIDVDAALMQFKSGGDEFGVTSRLRGVEEWDAYQAGTVTVWEANDGRRLIADGHQRLGLAKRISAQSGEDIQLNAFVLRESDGFTASDARILTAKKNVAEGSGTRTDAAKIFRELSDEDVAEFMARLSSTEQFVKDARGLARLDNEAFGAVINEVIPENYGAAIGQLVDDPAQHSAMVRVIAETEPPNRVQAEAIIRQAMDAGFVKEVQDSLFGSTEVTANLFAQRAKLLDRALKELRKMKSAFGVAARNADTLESGGNKISVKGSEAAAAANAQALALVERLALRKGNAVNELLKEASERLAAGERITDVTRDFVAGIRELDLAKLEQGAGADGSGAGAGRSGRGERATGEADGANARGPDDQLSPAEADAAAAARPWSDHSNLPPDPDPRFDAPDGEGIRDTTQSLWHDIDADQADFAAPTAEQTRIALEQQTEGGIRPDGETRAPGEDGGLFDTPDTQNDLFDLGDGKPARTIAQIRADLDADKAGIEAMKGCLK